LVGAKKGVLKGKCPVPVGDLREITNPDAGKKLHHPPPETMQLNKGETSQGGGSRDTGGSNRNSTKTHQTAGKHLDKIHGAIEKMNYVGGGPSEDGGGEVVTPLGNKTRTIKKIPTAKVGKNAQGGAKTREKQNGGQGKGTETEGQRNITVKKTRKKNRGQETKGLPKDGKRKRLGNSINPKWLGTLKKYKLGGKPGLEQNNGGEKRKNKCRSSGVDDKQILKKDTRAFTSNAL